MTQDGGRGAGGQDSDAERRERLHRFLWELVKREGRMEATVLLGVNYRTLVKAEESGEMTGRMSDALERLLLTWDGGVEDGDGDGDKDGGPEPGGDLARRVEALEAGWRSWPRGCAVGWTRSGPPLRGHCQGRPGNGDGETGGQGQDGEKGPPAQSAASTTAGEPG